MKKILLSALLLAGMYSVKAQTNDWAINFTHYTPGQIFNVDTFELEFDLKNNGPNAINVGDTLYISLKVNDEFYGDMMPGSPPYYAHVMTTAVPVGSSVTLNPGHLLLDPAFLGMYGTPTLDLCVVAWGIGLASVDVVTPSWPLDTNPSNNSACVVYDTSYDKPTDLAISFDNYSPGEVIDDDTLFLDFTIHNHGPEDLYAGDTLYLSARINGAFMGLNLIGTSTPYVLTTDLLVGDSLQIDPGYLTSDAVLAYFPGTTSFEACVVIWGKNNYAVDTATPSFPQDLDGSNNTSCVIYNEVLSVNDITENKFGLSVFPNPANNELNFKFGASGNYAISIFDMTGKQIHNTKNNNPLITLDVSSFTNGVYFYKINDEKGNTQTGKFLVD